MELKFKNTIDDIKLKKAYFDEILYITSYLKKIKQKPNKKISGVTSLFTKLVLFLAIFLILLLCLIEPGGKNTVALILIGVYLAFLILSLRYLLFYKMYINVLLKKVDDVVLKLDKTGFEYDDNEKIIKVKWDKVGVIVINKFTIAFISDGLIPVVAVFPATRKKEILKGLKECNVSNLVVDNQEKYK